VLRQLDPNWEVMGKVLAGKQCAGYARRSGAKGGQDGKAGRLRSSTTVGALWGGGARNVQWNPGCQRGSKGEPAVCADSWRLCRAPSFKRGGKRCLYQVLVGKCGREWARNGFGRWAVLGREFEPRNWL